MEPNEQSTENITAFIDFLFGGLEGFIYLAAKEPRPIGPDGKPLDSTPAEFTQEFFEYPKDVTRLTRVIETVSPKYEIYMAPAIFSKTDGNKENVKASNVAWADFDGNAPDWTDSKGEPSVIVQSSGSKHQHCYWRLTEPITDIAQLEAVNRNIAYNLQADMSGWDANQVLRPPATLNHKRGGLPVGIVLNTSKSYDVELFSSLNPAPAKDDFEEWDIKSLPDAQDVILKYSYPPDIASLFKKQKHEIEDRSNALMQLAYGCCEIGLQDNEIFTLLLLADDKWEKFKGRQDRNRRLAQIIQVARQKYPQVQAGTASESDDEAYAVAFDYVSFLNTEINIDWVIEGMLMEQGTMLMVGPSGVGKTQITLQFLIHIALGKEFLGYKVTRPMKVMFLSLEMDHGSLKQFMLKMNEDLTDPERTLLAENFVIVPHGEPWPLNTPIGQQALLELIELVRPEGLFIDSIGSSIKGAISSDEAVQPFLDFNDRIRKKYKLFTWFIHHMRKAQQGGSHAVSQDDVYGNQYLLNRATSSYGVLRGKSGTIKMRNFKNRLAPLEDDYYIRRTDNLGFDKITKDSDAIVHLMLNDEPEGDEPESGVAPNGFTI